MSNNAPDYENDLVFPPQEIKSQHELSEKGRQSDVLIKAIEKCEKLEKENQQLIKFLEEFNALEVAKENQQLKELLGECKYFLAEYDNDFSWDDCVKGYHLRETINKIIGEKK